MSLIDAFENDVLDAMLGSGASLISSAVEIALSTTTPADDGTNVTEPGGFGYARVVVNNDGTNWPAASGGEKANGQDIVFPQASGGNWGEITHWVLYDQGDGLPKAWGMLDDGAGSALPRQVNDGDVFRFLTGDLRIQLD